MRKDIVHPEVKNVAVAIIPEFNAESREWFVYFINFRKNDLINVMVSSSGYGEIDGRKKETTVLRYYLDEVKASSYKKFELIIEEAFRLTNQFWVSFYEGSNLYDKKFIFVPESIHERNMVMIPIVEKEGIIIR